MWALRKKYKKNRTVRKILVPVAVSDVGVACQDPDKEIKLPGTVGVLFVRDGRGLLLAKISVWFEKKYP